MVVNSWKLIKICICNVCNVCILSMGKGAGFRSFDAGLAWLRLGCMHV